jgi:hypothetical protein
VCAHEPPKMLIGAKSKKDKDKKEKKHKKDKKDKTGIEKKHKKDKKSKERKKKKELKSIEKKAAKLKVETMNVEQQGFTVRRELEAVQKKLETKVDEKKQSLSLQRINLIKKCKENDRIILFYRGEAVRIVSYKLPGGSDIGDVVNMADKKAGTISTNLENRKQITQMEIKEAEEGLIEVAANLNQVHLLLTTLNFASFETKVLEWRQDMAVMKLVAAKETDDRKDLLALLIDLVEERDALMVDINRDAAALPSYTVENDRRSVVLKMVDNLLKIIRSAEYLALYNQTQVLRRKAEGVQEVQEEIQELDLLWIRHGDTNVGNGKALKSIKQKMGELIQSITTKLKELEEASKITILTNNLIFPTQVTKTGIKVFIRPEDRDPVIVLDQSGNILQSEKINIKFMKKILMNVNEGLFLAPSQFPDPISKNGVYTAQDITKNQVITFYEGRVVKDSELPERRVLNIARLLLGSTTASINTLYVVGDERADGGRITSDDAMVEGMGAGAFIKDCIDLKRMQKNRKISEKDVLEEVVSEDSVELIVVEDGEEDDLVGGRNSLSEESEDADFGQFLSIGSYCDQFRLRVKDPEREGEMRSCINVALRVYDDQYNEIIRNKVSSSPDYTNYLKLLDPTRTIIVIEALRTIRAGEELFLAYSDTLWEEYLGWRKVPKVPSYPDTNRPTPDTKMSNALKDAAAHSPFVIRVPFVEGVVEVYEPLDDEEDDEEEEDEDYGEGSEASDGGSMGSVEEGEGDSYDELIEDYERKLVSMESFSSGSRSARNDAITVVKTLINNFKLMLEMAADTEETATLLYKEFIEIVVRMNMLEDDNETLFYSAEQSIGTNTTDPITLKQLREQLVIIEKEDIIQNNGPSPKIKEINEKRRLLLVHHKLEPSKPGDAEKIVAMFNEYR